MKKLEELGITPTPWRVDNRYIASKDSTLIAIMTGSTKHAEQDARMVAAAPELYEALLEAHQEFCFRCKMSEDDKREICDQCIVADWKDALAKASGESEVAK